MELVKNQLLRSVGRIPGHSCTVRHPSWWCKYFSPTPLKDLSEFKMETGIFLDSPIKKMASDELTLYLRKTNMKQSVNSQFFPERTQLEVIRN